MNRANKRVKWDEYFLEMASVVARRSTCNRRQYGAVITDDSHVVIATGYNGAPRGEPNCCDVGTCWRAENNIPHGERYEKCCAVHAEANAIISAARRDMIGSTMYLVGLENGRRIDAKPCEICAKLIKNAGIKEVICSEQEKGEIDRFGWHGRLW